jgi:hypothetical protein
MTIIPRIFLCHKREEKSSVLKIHQRLKAMGLAPWKDSEDLPAGGDWRLVIEETLKQSHFVLVCFTKVSMRESGYFQKEIREALEIEKEKVPGQVYLIPAKLEECDVRKGLTRPTYINLFDESGWKTLSETIQGEMKRRGCEVTTDEFGRLIFNIATSREDHSSDENTQLLRQEPTASDKADDESGAEGEANEDLYKTKPLVKPIKVRLQEIISTLEKLYGYPDLSEKSPLSDLLKEIEKFVEKVDLIEAARSEDRDFCIRCISGMLNRTVVKTSAELTTFMQEKQCLLSFETITPAAFTGLLLSEHMKELGVGGHYRSVSDLVSWRDGQSSEFRDESQQAVLNGAQISRVFKLMLPEPDPGSLSFEDKQTILERHLEDSEEWTSRKKGKYELRVFYEPSFNLLKKVRPALVKREHEVKHTHFGVFSRGTEGQTLVEYRVDEFDLSRMRLDKHGDAILDRLSMFGDVWQVASPLTSQDEIRSILLEDLRTQKEKAARQKGADLLSEEVKNKPQT